MSSLHERSNPVLSRRAILTGGAAACGIPTGLAAAGSLPPRVEPRATSSCFLLGLNTSTIRGRKLSCASGFQVMLSLELFNRQYWKENPLTVARTGLQKMKALVAASEQEPS
jgi:hypothetical protein